MEEMIYDKNLKEPKLLTYGSYNHINYYVMSYGTHPCAYIGFPEGHELFKKKYDCVDIDCHGGLTFSGFRDFSGADWLLGWDYAHMLDYTPYNQEGYKWSTGAIVQEIMMVIDTNKLEV